MDIDKINESVKRTIINDLYKSLYELGLDVNNINLDISTDAVKLKICICNK